MGGFEVNGLTEQKNKEAAEGLDLIGAVRGEGGVEEAEGGADFKGFFQAGVEIGMDLSVVGGLPEDLKPGLPISKGRVSLVAGGDF